MWIHPALDSDTLPSVSPWIPDFPVALAHRSPQSCNLTLVAGRDFCTQQHRTDPNQVSIPDLQTGPGKEQEWAQEQQQMSHSFHSTFGDRDEPGKQLNAKTMEK